MAEDLNEEMASLAQTLGLAQEELEALSSNPDQSLLLTKFTSAINGQQLAQQSLTAELENVIAEKEGYLLMLVCDCVI